MMGSLKEAQQSRHQNNKVDQSFNTVDSYSTGLKCCTTNWNMCNYLEFIYDNESDSPHTGQYHHWTTLIMTSVQLHLQ